MIAQQACDERQRRRRPASQRAADHAILDQPLQPLGRARRKRTAALHGLEIVDRHLAAPQRFGQDVRRGHGILDREVDPDPTDRRHRVCRVADAEQSGPLPFPQPIDLHCQQLDGVPVLELADAIGEEWDDRGDRLTEPVNPIAPVAAELLVAAFRDDEGALPVVAALQHHEHMTVADVSKHLRRIVRAARQAHPQHIDRHAEVIDDESRALPDDRGPSVRAHRERGSDVERAARRRGADPGDAPVFIDQPNDLGIHPQAKWRVLPAAFGEEIEEVPLRHQRDEPASRRQVREVGDRHALVADLAADLAHFLMRPLQKALEPAELVHHFQCRRMHGVAAEIAQEIAVLFEDDDVDAGPREQHAEHHAGRSAARDAAARLERFGGVRHSVGLFTRTAFARVCVMRSPNK